MKNIIDQIIQTTASEFGITTRMILGKTKSQQASVPRLLAMYTAWTYLGVADRTIAYYFNRKHGDSVRYARNVVPTILETNKTFRKAYQNIEQKLENTKK